MRRVPRRHALVYQRTRFGAGTASATNIRATRVSTKDTPQLESRAAVLVPLVIPVAAWTAVPVARLADRHRYLIAVPSCV